MGTGKTLSVLAAVDCIKLPTVVVCPAFLVSNWMNEVDKHSDLVSSPHFLKWKDGADITIVPYSQIHKAEEIFKRAKIIVTDEQHYLKNLDAKRTQVFHSYFYKYTPEYFFSLTGTPLKNRVNEIYSLLMLWSKWGTKPAILDKYKSYYTFCNRFTNVRQTAYGIQYSGSKNVEELRQYLLPYSIKHNADVLDLPELTESTVVAAYSEDPALQRAFEEFKGVNSANITAKVNSAISKANFTSQYVGQAIDDGLGPIVVFSDHRKPLEIMQLELSKFRTAQINGDISMDKRTEIIRQFSNGNIDVLLATYGAGSTGINLTSSNLMVMNDLPWTVADFEQAKKRSHRVGQTKPCRIVHIIGSKVDETILRALNAKTKTINKVMEGV